MVGTSYYNLKIQDRETTGTKNAKSLRKKGLIPGVLYYKGEDTINISIMKMDLHQAFNSGQRIFEIESSGNKQYVMVKDLQYHPVTDEIIHIDFMRVRRSEKIKISVPLILVGDAAGIKEGGLLFQSMNQIEIECFPTDVPEKIDLDISKLEINNSYSVADVKVPNDDISIVSAPELNIVSINTPAAEEEPESDEGQVIEDEEIGSDEGDVKKAEEKSDQESGENNN